MIPSSSSLLRLLAASIASIAELVCGSTGKPSDHPRFMKYCNIMLGSAGTSKVALHSPPEPSSASNRASSEQDSPAVNTLTTESILDSANERKISKETEPTG